MRVSRTQLHIALLLVLLACVASRRRRIPRWRSRLAQAGRHIHIIHRRGEVNLKSIRYLRKDIANLTREFHEFRNATDRRARSNSEGIKRILELLGIIRGEEKMIIHEIKEIKKQKKNR